MSPTIRPFPTKALAFALLLTMAVLGGVGWHVWDSYRDLETAQTRDVRLQELAGSIFHLDEVLTMSARLAAFTGDPQWEARYRRFEPALLFAIKEAEELAPSTYATEAAHQTEAANLRLVDMEYQSFKLLAAGDREGAAALLFSPAYEEQKRVYSAGNAVLIDDLRAKIKADLDAARRQAIVVGGVLAVALPLVIVAWVVVLRSMSRHITERKHAEQALARALEAAQERARRDSLTGALNHGAIVEELRKLLERDGSPGLAVAMVDVDGLKAVNDTYGHQVGDEVLVAVAGALALDGVVVGRYGGDEFVALMPGADRPAAERYRRDVLRALAQARLTDAESGALVPVVVSLGFAMYPRDAAAVIDLIRVADSAMYATKRRRPRQQRPRVRRAA